MSSHSWLLLPSSPSSSCVKCLVNKRTSIRSHWSIATDQGVAVHDDDGPPEEPFLHLGRKSPSLLLWDTSSVAATFNRTINAVENIGAPRRGGGRGAQCQARQCSPVSSFNPWVRGGRILWLTMIVMITRAVSGLGWVTSCFT